MARPPVFTAEVVDTLVKAIQLGASFATACRYAGISDSTFEKWRQGKFPRGASDDLKIRFYGRNARDWSG